MVLNGGMTCGGREGTVSYSLLHLVSSLVGEGFELTLEEEAFWLELAVQ